MRRIIVFVLLYLFIISTANGKELILQNGLNNYNGCQDSWASKKQVYFAGAEKIIKNYWTTPEIAADDSILIQRFEYSHT